MALVKIKNKESPLKDILSVIVAPLGMLALALAFALPAFINNDFNYGLSKALLFLGVFSCAAVAIYFLLAARFEAYLKIVGVALLALLFLVLAVAGLCLLDYYQQKNATHLIPGDDPDPSIAACTGVPDDALKTFLGSSESWATRFPHTILQMGGENMLVVDRGEDGGVQIKSIKIFDKDGVSIASFDDGDIWSSPTIRAEKKNKSTYVVYGKSSEEVMMIKFLNKNSLLVTGLFFKFGQPPVLATNSDLYIGNSRFSGVCSGNNAVDFVVNYARQ